MAPAYMRLLDITDPRQKLLFNSSINGLVLLIIITMAKYYVVSLSIGFYTAVTDNEQLYYEQWTHPTSRFFDYLILLTPFCIQSFIHVILNKIAPSDDPAQETIDD